MLKKITVPAILFVLVLLAVTACAPAAVEEPAVVTQVPTPSEGAVPTVELDQNIKPEDPEAKLRTTAAINDLAAKLGVDRSQIEVVAYEPITWNDGSLGCPQPDMMYTQALVDGYMIQLSVDGVTYNYHGENGRDPFLCENQP